MRFPFYRTWLHFQNDIFHQNSLIFVAFEFSTSDSDFTKIGCWFNVNIKTKIPGNDVKTLFHRHQMIFELWNSLYASNLSWDLLHSPDDSSFDKFLKHSLDWVEKSKKYLKSQTLLKLKIWNSFWLLLIILNSQFKTLRYLTLKIN